LSRIVTRIADSGPQAKPAKIRPLYRFLRRAQKLKDYYPLFANDPLLFEPGKGQSYSNTGFLVASMIVEQVSGQEFRQYLKEYVFKPAHMTRTGFGHRPGMALPYARDYGDDPLAPDSPWVSAAPFYKDLLAGPAAGPGGEYSTVRDLLRFTTALQSGKLLSSKEFSALIEHGYGCQCSAEPGHRLYVHGGGGPGVDTGLKFYVDQDFAVILLSNYSPPFPQVIASQIGDLLLGAISAPSR
jgi:CubicO group peptidase (beta-lactamase class C family)